eukprot:CAMPEP_0173415830 /NCGR_PEP_ID=MMETSP1356-20130122/85068_1 /TAXON_ID=77927 ORGANISM="Hemiselmis virescens, Strain PCC157" /NCGR_SAMPLE_ID=MMETSP1356 /ASSEMBLY_ACC=CAM_ASM_000847 /LENGTH=288 /DNA_ID=CAMNT_0014378109 /DNA_START=84 /DNA_END=948 /DNA_ORIENTATION=+
MVAEAFMGPVHACRCGEVFWVLLLLTWGGAVEGEEEAQHLAPWPWLQFGAAARGPGDPAAMGGAVLLRRMNEGCRGGLMRRPGERACLFPFDRGRMFIAAAFFSLPCTRLLFASLLSGRRLLRDRHPGHCRVSGRGGRVQRRCSRTLCSRGEGARFDGTCSMESSAVPADSSAGLCFIGGGNHRLRRRQRPRPYHREAASTTASSAGEPLTSSTDGVISGLSGFISWGGQRLHRQREFSALEAALPIVSPAGGASLTSSAEGGTAPASLAGAVPISLVGTALISISGW